MVSIEDINILGDIINSSWGKSSTSPTAHHVSIKAKILNEDTMMFSYTTIVNFKSYANIIPERKEKEKEAVGVLNKCVSLVKERFKELSGKTIKFSGEKRTDTVEIINVQPHINYRKTAYYRVDQLVRFSIS